MCVRNLVFLHYVYIYIYTHLSVPIITDLSNELPLPLYSSPWFCSQTILQWKQRKHVPTSPESMGSMSRFIEPRDSQ